MFLLCSVWFRVPTVRVSISIKYVLLCIATLLSSFFYIFLVIRRSVDATYTAAFSFAVLCQLFTFSVIWEGRSSQIGLCCLYFL